MLTTSEKQELQKKFSYINSKLCSIDTELDSKADLVNGVVPEEQLPFTGGTSIEVVSTYSNLPAANTANGEFYWVENSQGTYWLPGSVGGTYYSNGLYYSNGVNWIYTDIPYNASQVEVDAGLNNNRFITPMTFNNAAKWGTKQDTVTLTTTGTSGAATLTGATLNIPQYQSQLTFDNTPTNGSTNPITSDGVYDALQLKQDTVSLTTTGTSGAATLVGSTLNIPQYQGVLTNPVTGTGTAGQVVYFNGTSAVTGSSSLVWDAANGRLGVGTNTPTVQFEVQNSARIRGGLNINGVINNSSTGVVDIGTLLINANVNAVGIGTTTTVPSARLHVRGSGTTSATTALLVQNSTPTELFKVLDNGSVFASNDVNLGTSSTFVISNNSGGTNRKKISAYWSDGRSYGIDIETNISSDTTIGNGYGVRIYNPFQYFYTTGTFTSLILGSANFSPTSGTGVFNSLQISYTINQTGGANGITRGLYVNPTLTAAADWRSIEWSNNTGWGLYGAGTANNYLAGSLWIGSATAVTDANFGVSKTITGGTTRSNITSQGTINSDVTNTAYFFRSRAFTQATSFTLSSLIHYSAAQSTFGLGSIVTNQYGIFIESNLTGATNNYGFYGDIASGTGRWNLYMNGTAANYLAGNTSIGTTTSSGRLTVRGNGTTSATNGLLIEDSAGTDTFTIRDDGGYAFRGGTVGLAQTGYTTFTNLTTDRTCDANATTVDELADILGTLIEDLKTKGIIAA